MLSFLWGLAQGTLGVPLTSPYIGKWSGAAYPLYTFRTGRGLLQGSSTCGGLEDLEVECGDDGSGHIVVDVLLGLHHRCQVQQRDDSNYLLGVPSDLKSSQDGAEGRGVAVVPTYVVWSGS